MYKLYVYLRCVDLCDVDLLLFFFKQKTAYEMRISDWSSDVCSSDLQIQGAGIVNCSAQGFSHSTFVAIIANPASCPADPWVAGGEGVKIGRASCRERVCQYV